MEEGHLLLSPPPAGHLHTACHGREHWMLPSTATAHIHFYFFHSSLFFSFFPPPVGVEGGWVRNWENRATEIGLWRWTLPPWWQKTSEVSSPRFVQTECLAFFTFFLFAISGGWEGLVFSSGSSQGTEGLASNLKKNGTMLLVLSRLSLMVDHRDTWGLLSHQESLNPVLKICLARWYLLGSAIWGH